MFINYWTLVHIVTGILLFKFLPQKYNSYFYVMLLLLFYEVAEIYFAKRKLYFRRETTLDVIYDLVFGLMGYHLARIGLWFL